MSARPGPTVLVGVIMLAGVVLAAPVAAADVHLSVESVRSSVQEPAPGESFTLTVTVANGPSSPGPVAVTDVILRDADSTREFARVEDVGEVRPGDTLAVPVVASIDRAGTHQLTVLVVVRDPDGETHRVKHPLVMTVTEPDEVQLSLRSDAPVAGDPQTVEVTVANGDTQPISNLRLRLSGDGTVENPDRVLASLAAGTASTLTFDATFPEPGPSSLIAQVTYTTAEGSTRTVERALAVAVAPARVEATFDLAMTTANGSSTLRVQLEQFGNVALREVTVRAIVDGTPVAQANLPDVPAEGARTATLDASEFPPGELTVVAAFTAAGESRTVARTRPLENDAELSVSTAVENGSPVLRAELTQYGHVELRDVEFRVLRDGVPVARRPVSNVRRERSQVATFGPEAVHAGNLTVVAEYTVGEERQSTATSVQYAPAPTSGIAVTGIEVTRSGSRVVIRGDAANIGTRGASSLVLSVVEAPGVTPLNPNKAYFVGAVDASEFATFELTANVSPDVEAVPVRIEYSIDGERISEVRAIDVTDATVVEPARSRDSIPLVPLAVAVVVLIAVGVVVWRWRQG